MTIGTFCVPIVDRPLWQRMVQHHAHYPEVRSTGGMATIDCSCKFHVRGTVAEAIIQWNRHLPELEQ